MRSARKLCCTAALLIIATLGHNARVVSAAEGWELEVEACGEWHGCLRTRKNLGGAWLCEQAAAEIHKAVPGSSPEAWGFPEGTKVRVRAVCVRGEPRA